MLTQHDLMPFRLRDGNGWKTGLMPAWLLTVRAGENPILQHRESGGLSAAAPVQLPVQEALRSLVSTMPLATDLSGFRGGAIGWVSYDFNNPVSGDHALGHFPVVCIAGFDVFLYEPDDGEAVLYASDPAVAVNVQHRSQSAPSVLPFKLTSTFDHIMSASRYADCFERVQEYLRAGDCYQVNLAQAFRAHCQGDSLMAFEALYQLSTPPHAAFFCSPHGDILSLSPELFLSFRQGRVSTRPIKGTRPRGDTPELDAALREELRHHPKDRAENLMIVDLLRHDLGKHALTGSVRAAPLFAVESFPQVHHLVSTIECTLKPGSDAIDLLFDAFPGGSITGAPKKRAMEIIAELENFPRAVYCGSLGYLTPDGDGEWNIAIRTLLRQQSELFAWAGGGIVADSNCEDEYQECFNKIGPLLRALESGFGPR